MKSKGVQEEAANEMAEIFNEIVTDEIATKSNIEELKFTTKAKIDELKVTTKTQIDELTITTKAEIEKVKLELEKKIEQTKVEILKWVAGMLVGQAVMIIALIKLLD